MTPSEFTRARSELGRLTRKYGADNPLSLDARRRMCEAHVLLKFASLLSKLPTVSPELRVRIEAVLDQAAA
ncbi:hypothetical protein [Mycolicibacterium sp. A43C]